MVEGIYPALFLGDITCPRKAKHPGQTILQLT